MGDIYIDCFSGIGGWSLAAFWAGWRFDEHYFSEIESFPIKVFQQRFPDAVALGDIAKINIKALKEKHINDSFILSGSFPCQNISIAGKQYGIMGKESRLWFNYANLIKELQPRIAFVENVGRLTASGLDSVLSCLSEIGYSAEWACIWASDVGAPHERERIWIVAYPNGYGWHGRPNGEGNEGAVDREETEGVLWSSDSTFLKGSSYGSKAMADSNRARWEGEQNGSAWDVVKGSLRYAGFGGGVES